MPTNSIEPVTAAPREPSRLMRVKTREELEASGWRFTSEGYADLPGNDYSQIMERTMWEAYSGGVIDWSQSSRRMHDRRYFQPTLGHYWWTEEMLVEVSLPRLNVEVSRDGSSPVEISYPGPFEVTFQGNVPSGLVTQTLGGTTVYYNHGPDRVYINGDQHTGLALDPGQSMVFRG